MLSIFHVRFKWLIFNIVSQLWADVKYHVPTGFCFSPKASGFYPFDDATALAGEGGVGDVVWLIQASVWNQTCHSTNDRCEALASLKGCFFMFLFQSPSIPPPVQFLWGGEIYKCKCLARRSNRRFSALSAVVNNFFCNLQNLSGLNL